MTELTPEDEKLENEELSITQSFNKMPVEMAKLAMFDALVEHIEKTFYWLDKDDYARACVLLDRARAIKEQS